MQGLSPFGFRLANSRIRCICDTELKMRAGVIRSIFGSFFENVYGILRFSLASEQLASKNLNIWIRC